MRKLAENAIQQSYFVAFNNNYCLKKHTPRCTIFSIPNESADGWEGKKKKNTGMLEGASDMVVVIPGEVVFVETKTKTGYQSPKQKEFQERVEACGHKYYLVRNDTQFWTAINPHLIKAGLEAYNG